MIYECLLMLSYPVDTGRHSLRQILIWQCFLPAREVWLCTKKTNSGLCNGRVELLSPWKNHIMLTIHMLINIMVIPLNHTGST